MKEEKKELFISALPYGKKTDTLVIHCSAHNFRRHFNEFLEKHLELEDYDVIALPGAIQILTLTGFVPKLTSRIQKWITFLVKKHNLHRLILIGHDDCGWYREIHFGPVNLDLGKRQIQDLKEVAKTLHSELGIPVDIFFAHLAEGKVAFNKIE